MNEALLLDGSTPGSGQEVTASGSFDVVVKDGLGELYIGEQKVELEIAEDGTVTVADSTVHYDDPRNVEEGTGEGYLTIDSVERNEDGYTYTVNYTYHLTEATQEHSAQGEDSLSEQDKQHAFQVTVVDQDKDEQSATISIDIKDDVAEARDDQDSVEEDDPLDDVLVVTSGNVIKGERGDDPNDQSGKDTVGADGASVTHIAAGSEGTAGTGNEVSAEGTTTIEGQYGTLTIQSDGTYTYTLNETNIKVMGLTGAEDEAPLTDTFTYTLTDKDGDKDTAELTITITGADHEVAAFTPQNLTVDEALLPDGPGSGQEVTASGSFAVVVKDGLGELYIGDQKVGLKIAEDGTVTVADRGVHYDDPRNTGEGTGEGYLTIDSVERNEDGYTYTVNYTYHLTEATQEHAEEGADSLSEQDKQHTFQVTVVDQDDDRRSATISIDITDDVPYANPDYNFVQEADPTDQVNVTATGNVLTGAQGDILVDTSADVPGADGASVTAIASKDGQEGTATDTEGQWTVTGKYGTLIINADGSYTYTLHENNREVMDLRDEETLEDVFTYTLTDADRDSSKAALTITITGTNHDVTIGNVSALVVDEANLEEIGNAQGDPEAGTTASGTMLITARDGLASLTINGDEEVAVVVEDGKVTGIPGSAQTTDGKMHFADSTGYLTIDSIEDHENGTYTVHYTYHLENSTQEHDKPAEGIEHDRNHLTEDQQKDHSFTIYAKDQDGTPSDSVKIQVDIIDDIPVLTGNQASTNSVAIVKEQDLASSDKAMAEIDLAPAFKGTVSVGADGLGSERYELKLSGEPVATNLRGLAGEGAEAKYENIVLVENNGVILGVTDSNDTDTACFRIEVNPETGMLTFTLLKPLDHHEGDTLKDTLVLKTETGSFTVEYTVTDKDGDHVSTSMDLGTENIFKIEDWKTTVTVKGSADLTVDESYTVTRPDGTQSDRLASGDGNDKGAESNEYVFDAYKLFNIELGADDTGLEGTDVDGVPHPEVDHVFTLGFTESAVRSSDTSEEISSGLSGIYADAEGTQHKEEILLSLNTETNTITGRCGGNEVFTLTMGEDGKLTLTMNNGSGVSIVHDNPDGKNTFDEVAELANKINVTLTVTDRDGDISSDTADVTLKFEDDGPALVELTAAEAITSTALEDGTGTLSGKMTFDFGADGAAFGEGVQAMVVKVTDGGTVYTFNCVKDEDGVWSATLGEEDEARSFTINSDGTFTYSRPLTTDDTDTDVIINVTLMDGDGDTITASTTEYAPVVTTTDTGDLLEKGVAGCTQTNPNADVGGTSVATGTITLAQSEDGSVDKDNLQLTGWSGTITHTKLTDSHEDDKDNVQRGEPAPVDEKVIGSNLTEDLTLYLVQDESGAPVLVNAITEGQDYYGTLTFEKETDSKWDWKFALNEGGTLVNNMTEQETIEIDFNFKVSDGMLQGDGDLKITIKGTNDKPLFTADTINNLQELRNEHAIVVSSNENGEFENTFTAADEQKLQATDPDTDNGAGDENTADNHLIFSVAGMKEWNAGTVTGEGKDAEYTGYADNSPDKNKLESIAYDVKTNEEDGSTSIETTYGILTVNKDGSYTYVAKDTNKIGADEYVTETFVIRVTDAHGSYSEETIVITLRDKDHSIEKGNDITLESKEAGVAGNDDEFHLSNDEHKYNDPVTAQNGASKDFLFKDVDVNDTLTINPQAEANSTIKIDGEEGSIFAFPSITLGQSGKASCSLVVSQDDEGNWTFAWATDPAEGYDVVGTLVFTRNDEGEVNPSFNLNSESGFLDQLRQEESVSIKIPLSATSDGDSSGDPVDSTLTITIEGTNDQPTVTNVTIGNQITDEADVTAVIYPGEDTQEPQKVTLQGEVTASDVDNDNPQGEGLIYTLEKVTSTTDGSEDIPASKFESGTPYPGPEDAALPEEFDTQYTIIETTYGTLEIKSDTGVFTYTLKEPKLVDGKPNAIMALGKDQSVTETFTIRVTDEHGSWTTRDITITINGTNDAPVLTIDNLEVHATEDNISDAALHPEDGDHSTATVEAVDYDYGADLSYWFHDSGSNTDTQFIRITAEQLLEIINDNGVYKGAPASLKILQAILQNLNDAPIATLRLSETGELTLEVNQESVFIQALNKGDNLTFNLSDIAPGVEVVARDEHGAYSEGENVTLVLHGNDDDYTPVSVVVPHVKEEGVYRNEDNLVTDTHDAGKNQSYEQPGYGQHQILNSGKFAINDRDAGQITFSHDDQTWKESGTTLGGEEIEFAQGSDTAESMCVLGTYGYYVIELSSTMDENGVKTFDYTYHLYSDKDTPSDVRDMVNNAFTETVPPGWEGRLDAVDSIAQGEQVRDSVEIKVSTGGGEDKTFTLESVVSGSNDRPEITDVETVEAAESADGVTALKVSKKETSEENTMYLEESDDGQTLHIVMQAPANGESSHFVGQFVDNDPDKVEPGSSQDDGTVVVNYAFVNTGGDETSSRNVWTISEKGESASSEYGYITIDADGVFHIHLYEGAAKALGEGKLSKEDIFEGLGVRCIDDLGATSNIVHLSGHLVGVDDKATVVNSREDLWEGVHDHDTSIPVQDLAPDGKPLAEFGGKVIGKVVVTDPDDSDTFSHIVTVTVEGEDHILVFDENGILSKVDDTKASALDTGKGEFGFTLHITNNQATLEYTYSVNDQGLDAIDKLDDGDFVKDFESIDVSFTSITKDEDGTTTRGTSSATISIDVHGTNDAPVIETVQTAHGEPIKITDDNTVVSGGTLEPKEQTSGKITATDPDEGETSELTYGILIYTDEENNEHIVYGQTGEDGRTKYFAVDGSKLPEDINLDSLTFTNHADLEHGSIYVDDDGNYTYSRYPNDGGEGSETVYITVRDPDGAMDHVEIKFELDPGDGGRLPDVTMKGDIPLEVIEPSDAGDRVHVGDEESSASSFEEGIVEKLSITVSYYQDQDGYHLLDKDENGNLVHLDGTSIPDDVKPSTATGKLVPTENGSYKWEYTGENGEPLEGFTVPLDIRLTPEGEGYGWDDGTYSLQTKYGTVYVDRATGELRFELDSRADTLNAGEVHSESVVIWINGSRQEVSLDVTVTGTADASEVETEALSVDLHEAGEDATVKATGTLTIDDIDNDAGAEDRHTLAIEVTGEDGEPTYLKVENGTTIYVMAGEDGILVYTDVKPEGDNWNSCYGELSFGQNEDGSYDYTFTAYTDSTVSKEIQDNDHLGLRVPVIVTDIAPDAGDYPEGRFDEEHYKETKTEAEIAITVTGKADAPDVTDSSLDITEEGTTPEGQGDGSHSVTGSLEIVDYDDSGVTVTGIEGELEEGQAFENGSTVVPGKYGTLVLHNDGTYTYTVNYDEVQYLAQGEFLPDVFTVAVGNNGGHSLATITVNVHGTNDLPTVTVTPVLTVQEQHGVTGAITVSGRVEAQDVDATDTLSYGFSTGEDSGELVTTLYVVGTWVDDKLVLSTSTTKPSEGFMGTLTMDEDGEYTFRLEDTETTRSLPHGESAEIVVQAGASDSHSFVTRPVTITIKGSNEAPEVTTDIRIGEDALVNSSSVTVTPGDGSGYIATDADRDTDLSYTFSRDGEYRTTETGTITLEDGTQYLVGLAIDPVTGTITISYEDEALEELIDALGAKDTLPIDTEGLQVVVQDGEGGRTSSDLTLTIQGANDAPVIGSATMNNNEGSLTFSDVDKSDRHTISVLIGDESYQVDTDNNVVVDGLGTFTFEQTDNGWDYSFVAAPEAASAIPSGEERPYSFKLQVSDGTESGTTEGLTVTVTGTGQETEEGQDLDLSFADADMALFANVDSLDTLASLSNSLDDNPADTAQFSGARADTSSQSQNPEDMDSPFENALRLLEDPDSEGTKLLFARDTYSLADGEEMYSLSPDEPEENTVDIVAYDSKDYMVDGGEGVSFMVSENEDLTMDDILQGDGRHGPIVSNIDVLITGHGAESLTNMDQLARDYGIAVDRDANALTLDESWQKVDSGHTDTQVFSNGSLTLETSLDVSCPSDDLNVQAAMHQVTNN